MDEFNNSNNINNQEDNQPIEVVAEPIILDPPLNNDSNEYSRPPKKQKAKFSFLTVIVSVVLSVVMASFSGAAVFIVLSALTGEDNKVIINSDITSSGSGDTTNTTIYVEETATNIVEAVTKKAGPSVVGITTTDAANSFFGGEDEIGEGSGIIYRQDGYIITNYHVISSAVTNKKTTISVYLSSAPNNAISATVVGYNISSDLAVIKINKTGLTAIELGNSDELKVGQYAVAIGSPGGMEFMNSVSFGIISGLNRSVSMESGNNMTLIQTDAAINPGNSGGALLNSKGQLIGVNSAKLVDTSFEGMGFAIPVNSVKEICDKIISNKNDDPAPYIGVEINTQYTAEILKRLGYPEGVVVNSVIEGGPADEAGIERGDIITEFNGKTITEFADLEKAIASCKAGDSVTIKIYRGGRFYSATVRIASNNA